MWKIVITGASGFVGKNLMNYIGTYNSQIEAFPLSLRSEVGSVDVNNIDAIVHLAGKAHDLKKSHSFPEYHKVNFELTKKVFDQFLNSNATKFIFLSSVKAVADSVDGELTELQFASPITDYGRSKLLAEEYILSRQMPADKQSFILRPCMIHGPGNKGNLNLLYWATSKGIPYPLASFINRRSFLTVENLCFVVSEIIKRNDIPPGVYNISDSDTLSTKRVVEIMFEELNKRPRLFSVNKNIIKGIASIGDILSLPFNSERLNKLTESYVVNNSKILAALKKPLPVGAEDGLRRTIKSFISGI